MERMNALISYFLRTAPCSLNRTQIVKMCYLLEYHFVQTYGEPFLKADFIRYYYGPFATEVYHSLNHLVETGCISQTQYYDAIYYNPCNPSLLEEYKLDDEVKPMADFVVRKLSSISYKEMVEYVYATPPMQAIREHESMVGHEILGRRLDMKKFRDDVVRRFTAKDLLAARSRRNSQPDRGDQHGYIRETQKEYYSMSTLRERVNKCIEQ